MNANYLINLVAMGLVIAGIVVIIWALVGYGIATIRLNRSRDRLRAMIEDIQREGLDKESEEIAELVRQAIDSLEERN